MTKELTKDLFDFSDTSDLSEAVQGKLSADPRAGTALNAKKYADLVNVAGRAVSISEIMGAAERFFGADEVPSSATVRKYLNAAVEDGLIKKPTKASYGALDVNAEEVEGEEEEEAPVEEEPVPEKEEENDPLEGL